MRARLLVLSLALPAAACAPTEASNDALERELRALVDSVAAEPGVPGAVLYAYSPSNGLEWSGAAGVSDVATGEPLRPDQTVRNASNTKTYVAAAVLRLWEMGRLELDDPVATYLGDEQVALLAGDGYDMDAITIRHLLSHSSGLIDHGSAQEYFGAITADPARRWTRDEQLAGAVAWGDPLWGAGQAYAYSDTGYILLGQVIENVTGEPLGPAVRDLVGFDALGLDATWWEIMEAAPATAGARAHQYIGGVDANAWDASLDSYGGGGLVTSSRDLAAFWYALFRGRVFEAAATLDTMLTTPLPAADTPYRLGVFVRDLDGLVAYEHSGFWGTRAVYVPQLDLVVAGAVTEQSSGREVFVMTERAVALIAGARGALPPGR
ncbi:MAG TPA: serine hydrolase domain-containing protein [Longimicrobiales bacterium]|nr:serine hydrolase domain-containing protein [Longimicrobiales bacterium]